METKKGHISSFGVHEEETVAKCNMIRHATWLGSTYF